MENQWISTKEKVPPYLESVLLSNNGWITIGCRVSTTANGEHYRLTDLDDDEDDIEYWMPLPDCPTSRKKLKS